MRTVMWIHCPDTGFMITMPQGHRNIEYVGPFLVPEPYQAGDCPFRYYPPLGWGAHEADLFWRDFWQGHRP